MRNLKTPHRALILLAMLFGVAHAGWAEGAWPEPLDSLVEIESPIPVEPIRPGVDPCGCLREVRACLIGASLDLGRCLSRAQTPARRALCYLKFEIEVLLCIQRAAVCEHTCVP